MWSMEVIAVAEHATTTRKSSTAPTIPPLHWVQIYQTNKHCSLTLGGIPNRSLKRQRLQVDFRSDFQKYTKKSAFGVKF